MLLMRIEQGTFECIGVYFGSDTGAIPTGQSEMSIPFSYSIYRAKIGNHFDGITWFVFDATWIRRGIHF